MNKTAAIVARFQTPFLTEGHKYLLDTVTEKHHKVIVILGVSIVKGSIRNPFDFITREKMLKKYMPGLVVLPLDDYSTDTEWSKQLDRILNNTFSMESFVLYGSRDSFIPYYSGRFQTTELPEFGDHNATAVRTGHADQVLDTDDFRLGINYAYHNMYPRVFPTVDMALFNNSGDLLLGKKYNQRAWRLPGGFVDPADDSFEVAAKRELREECGSMEVSKMEYVGTMKVFDWRYNEKERDKIITTLYQTKLVFGNPVAGDDLEFVSWFSVEKIYEMMEKNEVVPEHIKLIKMLKQFELQA